MPIDCELTSARVEMRRLNARDVVSVADTRHILRNVGPGCAAVFTDLNISIVSSHPKHSREFRRLRDSYDVPIAGITVVLRGHRIFAGYSHDRKRVAIDLF